MGTVDDTFRILVATDNHLGFAEKDPERGNDTFITFEEILEMAVGQNVDFILLGGDLFHENKPSRQCQVHCMELLRKYTFGDKPVLFDFISDPVENFTHSKNPVVNYMDPNLNVSIPVFSIHGNHDDPSGPGQYCALEMLSSAGLINYFGRTTDLKEIKISPLLMEKGRTKLSIYGLSAIKDERLFRLFKESKVTMLRPNEMIDSWFNIMVLHQNHVKHGMTNYIPENFLDPFLDVVIWGHEHECLIEPRQSSPDSFHVIQPGSSVATSLCAGEAKEKNVALLEVNHDHQFKTTALPLKTVRPFVFDEVCLADHNLDNVIGNNESNPVEEFIEDYVRKMIRKAKKQITGHPKQPKKPLIRLRIEYSHESQMFNVCRFGHKFENDVANPTDIVLFKKMKQEKEKDTSNIDTDAMDAVFAEDVSETRVEDLVEQYFAALVDENQQMLLLTERGLAGAVHAFVEKDDKDAISTIFQHQVDKTRKHLLSLDKDFVEDDVLHDIMLYREERLARLNPQQQEEETLEALSNPVRGRARMRQNNDEDERADSDFDLDDDDDEPMPPPARGRGSRGGRGRGARGSRATGSSSSSSRRGTSSRTPLTLAGDGSPKPSASGSRGRGSRGQQQLSRNQSTMDTFCLSSQKTTATRGRRRGVVFDSDSD